MRLQSLNGAWELRQAGSSEAIPAKVPGCVHLDLLANAKLPDPFYRDNEKDMLWIGECDWIYRRTFEIAPEFLKHKHLRLRCLGLDTLATVRINGKEISKTDNMFRTYEWDVKRILKAGENEIEIAFAAPLPYQRRMDFEKGAMVGWVEPMRVTTGGWIRKEPCNFGWDWGPKLPTSGIWRDIELVAFDTARIADMSIRQTHYDGKVDLRVSVKVEPRQVEPITAVVSISMAENTIFDMKRVTFDGDSATVTMTINNPKLWWPNGMGEQPLYEVLVGLFDKQLNQLDYDSRRIGLRTLSLERHPDEWGESFYFACNGVPFFAKGANWIPASPYPSAPTRHDYYQLVQAAKDANMNMLRVWGGGIYEDNHFYAACDELGITVWQDFMFACGTYPSHDADFMANVKAEAEDNVRRLRHHASIALWCGNNEIEQGMQSGWDKVVSWEDYSKLFDGLLADVVRELAPQSSYWPASPHSPLPDRTDWINPDYGDTHLWFVWHGKQPFEWYRTRPDRFCSEFGFQSFPEPSVVYEFTKPEDHNILSPVMQHHQRSHIGNDTIAFYMKDWYRDPKNFEMMLWMSQVLQGMAMKYAVEHWRRNMPRTMGTLYWQHNDMWPAASWAGLDWKGNWKALHYMAKRFYAPLLISGLEDSQKDTIEIHLTSDKRQTEKAQIRYYLTTAKGDILEKREELIEVAPQNTLYETLDLSSHVAKYGADNLLLWLELWQKDELVSDNLVTLARPKAFDLPKPEIEVKTKPAGKGAFDVTLSSKFPALYLWLELPNAKLSDNFIHLRPKASRTIRVKAKDLEELKVHSLVDTY
jgi:beta-mannosidase